MKLLQYLVLLIIVAISDFWNLNIFCYIISTTIKIKVAVLQPIFKVVTIISFNDLFEHFSNR